MLQKSGQDIKKKKKKEICSLGKLSCNVKPNQFLT